MARAQLELWLDRGWLGSFGMPIYFIHVRQGRRLAKDTEGKCFPDLHAAEREAIRAAREMAAQRVRAGKTLRLSSRLEIVDSKGKVAAVVTFKDAIPISDADELA